MGRKLPREPFETERREFITQTTIHHYCPICHNPANYNEIYYRWDSEAGHSIVTDPVAVWFGPCGCIEGDISLAQLQIPE